MKNDFYKAMLWQNPEQIPVGIGMLPATWMKYRDELTEIVAKYPSLFGDPNKERDYDAIGMPTYAEGEHVDVWGCVWSNVKQGMEAIVTKHPVRTRADVHTLEIPEKDDLAPHGFMYLRLGDLRGFEEIMLDFAEEPPELQMLIDKVLAYNLRQMHKRVEGARQRNRPNNIMWFGDDLGMQESLPMSPEKWRKYLKPCFTALYKVIKDAGHYVHMHTDGHILEIIPDLVECGVDVINAQVGANGMQALKDACADKVCLNLDLDRQMFPFWTPAECDAHVKEAVETLGDPRGGLWLGVEIGEDVPLENVDALCSALERYRQFS